MNVSSFLLPFPLPSLGVPPSVFFPSLFPFSSYSLSFSAFALCRVSDPSQPRFSPFSLSFFLSSYSLLPSFPLFLFLPISFPPFLFLSSSFLSPSPSSPSPFHPASTIPYPGAPRQPIGVPHSVWAGLCVGGVPPTPPPRLELHPSLHESICDNAEFQPLLRAGCGGGLHLTPARRGTPLHSTLRLWWILGSSFLCKKILKI